MSTDLRSAGLVIGFLTVSCFGLGGVLELTSQFVGYPANLILAVVSAGFYLLALVGALALARALFREPGSSEASDLFAASTENVRVIRVPGLYRIVGHHEQFAPLCDPPTLWLDEGLCRQLNGFAAYEEYRARVMLSRIRTVGTPKRWTRRIIFDIGVLSGVLFLVFWARARRAAAEETPVTAAAER